MSQSEYNWWNTSTRKVHYEMVGYETRRVQDDVLPYNPQEFIATTRQFRAGIALLQKTRQKKRK